MKIGLDISQIVYAGTGVSRFTAGLTNEILKRQTSPQQWVFFFSGFRKKLDPAIKTAINNAGQTLKEFAFPPQFLNLAWNKARFGYIDDLIGQLDWFISSDWSEPRSRARKATVVHDLAFRRFPQTVTDQVRTVQEARLAIATRECRVIFADSETTRNDLLSFFPGITSTVVVNYPGVTTQPPSKKMIALIKQKYQLNKPFILTVGKIEPRKNLNRLMTAFLATKLPTETDLAVVGPPGWGKLAFPPNQRIRLLGYIPDEELYALYAACEYFIFPSLWEGFGYPLVEAMQCGAAAAAANTSSLREIGREATLFFDPQETDSIAKAILRLSTDRKLRSTLIDRGRTVLHRFQWKNYYDLLISTLEKNT
ncbi:glycosyltransferase family 4 protein [Candidatus Roizmanbacteria bacterium]|nr:glycosyltransferase family 4 protein [Candidatus Roizmanbacteria bacterium]